MSFLLNHLESIWYHSEPSDISYLQYQFLGLDFIAASHSKTALAYFPKFWRAIATKVRLGIKELLNKEQIGFKELFTD